MDGIDRIADAIATLLDELVGQGFEFPVRVVVLGANAGIVAMEYSLDDESDEVGGRVLVDACPKKEMTLPANVMVADSRGEAARIVVTAVTLN